MTPSRHDPERRQALGDHRQGMVRLELGADDCLYFLVHQRLDLVRPRTSHDDQSEIVADEVQQGGIGKHSREVLENFRR